MVRDLSQTQKALMCPTSQLAYFGIVRFAVCDIGNIIRHVYFKLLEKYFHENTFVLAPWN